VSVRVPTDRGVGLVSALLDACSAISASSVLRFVNNLGDEMPTAAVLSDFFEAVAAPSAGLLLSLGKDQPPLPPPGPLSPQMEASYETLGRLLGYAARRGCHVPMALPSALLCYLVRGELLLSPSASASTALSLVSSVDCNLALELRALLARRHGLGAPDTGALSRALGAGSDSSTVVSDANKSELVLRAARNLLVACRLPALERLRAGMQTMLGDVKLDALSPGEIACIMLGWEQPPRPSALSFGGEWGDESLRRAYEGWLARWIQNADAPSRCGFYLLMFGSLSARSLRRSITVLPGSGHTASFSLDTAQLLLPAASSVQEFESDMTASLVL